MASRPLTLADLTDDLLWPRLLRVPARALAPGRMALAYVAVVLLSLGLMVPDLWLTGSSPTWRDTVARLLTSPPPALPAAVFGEAGVSPDAAGGVLPFAERWLLGPYAAGWALIGAFPFSSLFSMLWSAGVIALLGGAIARSAAVEVATGVRIRTSAAVGFASRRWFSMLAALVSPLVIVVLIGLALAVVGWAVLGVPFLKVAGAAAFPVALAGGLAAVLLLIGHALGWPMLIPAVCCEGSDGLDAFQRVFAYVIARPLRLIVYTLVAAGVMVVSAYLLTLVLSAALDLTTRSLSAWLGSDSSRAVGGFMAGTGSWSDRTVARVMSFWSVAVMLLVPAFAISGIFTAGSTLYLLMRRVTDGQDVGEIHRDEPGGPA